MTRPDDCIASTAMRAQFPDVAWRRWSDECFTQAWNSLTGQSSPGTVGSGDRREGDVGLHFEMLREVGKPWQPTEGNDGVGVRRPGARVVERARLDDLIDALRHDDRHVVVLVAHAPSEVCIEFRDGYHTNEHVARCVAQSGFTGTLYLAVCHSGCDVESRIRNLAGTRMRIVSAPRLVWLGLHAAALLLTMRLLKGAAPMTFIDAFAEAWSRIRESAEQSR